MLQRVYPTVPSAAHMGAADVSEKPLSVNRQPSKCSVPGVEEAALSLLQLAPHSKVLDLGCYHGSASRVLASTGYKVWSCDLEAHPDAQALPNFMRVDANRPLPYDANFFDGVLCTEVIEHLENPTLLIRECARILSPGGVLVVSTPAISNLAGRLCYLATGEFPTFGPRHFHEWGHLSPVSRIWLILTAKKHGLLSEAVSTEAGPLGWKRRLASSLLRLPLGLLIRQHDDLNFRSTVIIRFRKTCLPNSA